jgi:hypothetical protein
MSTYTSVPTEEAATEGEQTAESKRVDAWRAMVSCAAQSLVVEATDVLQGLDKSREPIVDAIVRAARDGADLVPVASLDDFHPSEAWKKQYVDDVRASTNELGRLLAAMSATHDPLIFSVGRVAASSVKLLAVLVGTPDPLIC